MSLFEAIEDAVSYVMSVPQWSALRGDQTVNHAGGHVWSVDDATRLRRFLCLGVESGTFYVKAPALALENAAAVLRLLRAGRGAEVVHEVVAFSEGGRTAKQDPLLFVLAMCVRLGDEPTRKAAFEAFPRVCRIPTHVFAFVQLCETLLLPADADADADADAEGKDKHMDTGRRGKDTGTPASTGWGRAMRRAVGQWYTQADARQLAYAVTKYRNRNGWAHRDLLRLTHCHTDDPARQLVLRYIAKGAAVALAAHTDADAEDDKAAQPDVAAVAEFLRVVERVLAADKLADADADADANADSMDTAPAADAADNDNDDNDNDDAIAAAAAAALLGTKQRSRRGRRGTTGKPAARAKTAARKYSLDDAELAQLIRQHHLAREHLPTARLDSAEVWAALLESMPMTALVRNLNKMTVVGLLQSGNEHTNAVIGRLTSTEALRKARVHPFNLLVALRTYERGRGDLGKLTWEPLAELVRALEEAFYLSFAAVEPTGQRIVVAMDVSGSMSCPVLGSNSVTCKDAAFALAMVSARIEPARNVHALAFTDKLVPLAHYGIDLVHKALGENVRLSNAIPFGATDCAQPMLWAKRTRTPVDTFIVFTDNETWAGAVHPSEALRQYRASMGIPNARLITVGLAANEFTIADPKDARMFDMAGFDANGPDVMRQFMLGEI